MSANYRCNLATSKEKYLEKLKERNLGAYEYLMEGINIISRLNEKMFEAYIVGGAVRDILLNKDFNDIDICTTATPNEVMEVFPDSDGRYAEMGVVTVKVNEMISMEDNLAVSTKILCIYVLTTLGLCCCSRAFSGCSVRASHYGGVSCC